MLKRLLCGLAACCLLFALAPAGAKADTVRIDDLTDGVPTVQVLTAGGVDVTASRVIIHSDSAPEFLHFQIFSIVALPAADYTDLFEDFLGGTLSDRFLLVVPAGPIRGNPFFDVFFASDPAQLSNAGALNSGLNAVETGSFQLVLDFGGDQYFVRSDAPGDRTEVPGPATLTLLGIGTLTLVGSRAWRRRKAIADATRPTSAGDV